MAEPFTRAGLRCQRTEHYLPTGQPDMVSIKRDGYAIVIPGHQFDDMDDAALTSFFKAHFADAVEHRIHIFKLPLIKSWAWTDPFHRWHWMCRQCYGSALDFTRYRTALDAEAAAQNHVNERHPA